MKIAACIGSRQITPAQKAVCEDLGTWLAENGWVIRSGNAPGADQAFAEGANRVNPRMVGLALPWQDFHRPRIHPKNHVIVYQPEWEEFASRYHPAWATCSPSARKLLARNWAIIMGKDGNRPADIVLAVRKPQRTGGTEHAVSIAEGYGIPVLDTACMTSEAAKMAILLTG